MRRVTEIQIRVIKPKDGLLGFASVVLDGNLYLSSIGIFSKLDGSGYRITYPTKKVGNLDLNIFHPINKDLRQEIEQSNEPIALVVDTVDRLQRSFRESVQLDDLRKAGKLEIHFYRENLVINKDSNSADLLRWITDSEYDRLYQSFREKVAEIDTRIGMLQEADDNYYITAKYLLELVNRAYELFKGSEVEQRRQLIKLVLQNLRVDGRLVKYSVLNPFDTILNYADRQLWLLGQDYTPPSAYYVRSGLNPHS